MLLNTKIKDKDYKYTLDVQGGGKRLGIMEWYVRKSQARSISLRKAPVMPSQSYYFNSER